MSSKRTVVLLGILLASITAYAFKEFYNPDPRHGIRAWLPLFAHRPVIVVPPVFVSRPELQLPPGVPFDRTLPPTVQERSDWLEGEKAFYQKLLSNGKFETLVVPCQVRDWAFDHATRAVMSGELALAVSRAAAGAVPDPFIVEKALGEGQRHFNRDDVSRLAGATGVKHVVWCYVGHDRNGSLGLTIGKQETSDPIASGPVANASIDTKAFEHIPFNEESPAIRAYESLLPEVLRYLGRDPGPEAVPAISPSENSPTLPTTPKELLQVRDDPVHDAYTLELLAALVPKYLDATRERFAAKAYMASLRVPPTSPDFVAVRARAYKALGMRLAALKLLATPRSDEEYELLALLNGNLPQISALASGQTSSLKRLLETLDESVTRANYSIRDSSWANERIKALGLRPGSPWAMLVYRALTDRDPWAQDDGTTVRALMDADFPVDSDSLDDLALAYRLSAEPGNWIATVGTSVLSHARKYIEGHSRTLCCQQATDTVFEMDYLELLQAIGQDNLMRRMRFLNENQGLPRSAMEFANAIDATYRGNPYYSQRRGESEIALLETATDAERPGLEKSSYDDTVNALLWSQGQTYVASQALFKSGGGRPLGFVDNYYLEDNPVHPFFYAWSSHIEGAETFAQAAVRNATSEFSAVTTLAYLHEADPKREEFQAALAEQLAGRFAGCPARSEMLARDALRRGDGKTAEAFFRENIQLAPSYWNSYKELGSLLIGDGRVDDAARLFDSYPGFKASSDANRVEVANNAWEAGSYFYWIGRFDLAGPLLRIASESGTGAESDIDSTTRLDLLAGKYDAAMAGMQQRALRYQSPYGYRDFLAMLHASGRSDDAWAAFASLTKQSKDPQIWETALVGHRLAGLSEQQAVDWAERTDVHDAGELRSFAAAYLSRFGTTDRTPSSGLAAIVDQLDRATWSIEDRQGQVVRVGGTVGTAWIIGPVAPEVESSLFSGALDQYKRKRRLRSDMSYFVEGYRDIKRADFVHAKAVFEEAATFYDLSSPTFAYLLPYLAWASVRAGDSRALAERLDRYPLARRYFSFHLASAIVAGGDGKKDLALQELKLARYRRPHTDGGPAFTEYTLAEIGELLSGITHDGRIRDVTLDWSRKSQAFEPWYAWKYALEATLARDPVQRKRAIAMAHYLDPRSERLARFSRTEIDDAVATYGRLNPFLMHEAPSKQVARPGAGGAGKVVTSAEAG